MARLLVLSSSQYLEYTGTAPVADAPMTLAIWGRPVNTGELYIFGVYASGGSRRQMALFQEPGTLYVRAWDEAGGLGDATMGASTTNVWHHYAGVYTSTSSRTPYFDGAAGTTNTATVSMSGLDRIGVGISHDSLGAILPYDGLLAEAGVWNVALTAAEIADLASGALPVNVRPASLVFYSPLLGSASPEPDRSGGGRPLTPVNGPVGTADHPPMRYPGPKRRGTVI